MGREDHKNGRIRAAYGHEPLGVMMDLRRVFIRSELRVVEACDYLVMSSVWFEVEPMPDDYWEITVKAEAKGPLRAAVEKALS